MFSRIGCAAVGEWPDGRREALLFVLEVESKAHRFSIHRLAHCCLDLAELFGTNRVVPVVIFLRGGRYRQELTLGGERHAYLRFNYLVCALATIPFERYRESDNIVARLNLPNMRYPPEHKVEVYAQAVRGLLEQEPDPDKQIKYLDFIDMYAGLDDNEMQQYQREYCEEANIMATFAERFRQEGMQQGEVRILIRLLRRKYGDLSDETLHRIETADAETLLEWSDRVLTAESVDEVLQ